MLLGQKGYASKWEGLKAPITKRTLSLSVTLKRSFKNIRVMFNITILSSNANNPR